MKLCPQNFFNDLIKTPVWIVLLLTNSVLADFGCPEAFKELNGYCYATLSRSLDFDAGAEFCQSLQGYLLFVLTEEENEHVARVLAENEGGSAWLGMRVDGNSLGWTWFSSPDPEPVTYSNWNWRSGAAIPGRCGVVNMRGEWSSRPCSAAEDIKTVCKIPLRLPTGSWSPWVPEDKCSVSCGGGLQLGKQTCQSLSCSGRPGTKYTYRSCNTDPCPSYGPWSDCQRANEDTYCLIGVRTRKMECPGGGPCNDAISDKEDPLPCRYDCRPPTFPSPPPCTTPSSQPSTTSSTSTTSTSTTSTTSTSSTSSSSTTFTTTTTTTTSVISVTEDSCPSFLSCSWLTWTAWTGCSATCGSGTKTRTRSQTGGDHCTHTERETVCCQDEACPFWTEWESWSEVCKGSCESGSKGTQSRRRECVGTTAVLEETSEVCSWEGECETYEKCKEETRVCNYTAPFGKCLIETTEAPLTFEDLSTGDKIATVFRYAFNALGSIFLISICGFEIFAYLMIRSFSPHRLIHMMQEITLLICHVCILLMPQADKQQTSCLAVSLLLNWGFVTFFSFLCAECLQILTFKGRVLPTGTLIPLKVQILTCLTITSLLTLTMYVFFGKDGFTFRSIIMDETLCWINLNLTYPSRAYFLVYSSLVFLALIFAEASSLLEDMYPEPFLNTNWDEMDDAEFAYTGIYLKIFLSYSAWGTGLAAFTTSITAPSSPASLALGSASMGLNVALGSCIFFYHSFGNAKVRELLRKMKKKILGCWYRGRESCRCCRPSMPLITVSPSSTDSVTLE